MAFAACGGDDKADSAQKTAKSLSDAIQQNSAVSKEAQKALDEAKKSLKGLPDLKTSEREYKKTDATIRVANFYNDGTDGVDITLYWGRAKSIGKKVIDIPYGEVSDPIAIEVISDPFVTNNQPDDRFVYSYYAKGADEDAQPLNSGDETLKGADTLLLSVGWAKPYSAGEPNGSSSNLANLSKATTPSNGKTYVISQDIGIGGAFVVLGADGACDGLPLDSSGIGIPGTGSPTEIEPGSHELFTYDANTECENKSESTTVELGPNELWMFWTYAAAPGNAKVKALKLT